MHTIVRLSFILLVLVGLSGTINAQSAYEVISPDNLDRLALLQTFTFESLTGGQNFLWLPDSSSFIVASDHQIMQVNLANQSEISHTLFETESWITHIALSADGSHLGYSTYESQGNGLFDERGLAAHIVNFSTGTPVAFIPLAHTVRSLGLNANGTQLITVDALTYDFSVWDVYQQSLITTYRTDQPGYPFMLNAVFNADASRLALGSGSSHNLASIWDAHTGEKLSEAYGYSTELAFSWDSQWLLGVTRYGGEALVWDSLTGEHAQIINFASQYARATAISPDSRIVAAILEPIAVNPQLGLYFWDGLSGIELQGMSLDRPDTTIQPRLGFSPNGQYLLTHQWSNEATIWGIPSGTD
jgi:WD40 repeat protein